MYIQDLQWVIRSSKRGPDERPPSLHPAQRHGGLPGEGHGGGAPTGYTGAAWVLVPLLHTPTNHAGSAGTCGMQTTQGVYHVLL